MHGKPSLTAPQDEHAGKSCFVPTYDQTTQDLWTPWNGQQWTG